MHTAAYLKSQLAYDSDTGLLTWNVTRNRVVKGQAAGNKHLGYIRVRLNGRNYAAHRLAWLFSKGAWPKNEIDHINGVRDDNRICNLREATHSQNLQNCNRRRSNLHGLRGVSKQTLSNRWAATITANGVKHNLGTFHSPQEAHEAYLKAVPLYHGTFANLVTANHKEISMSRKQSVVLTPAEKKAVVAEAKAALKAAQAEVKAIQAQAKLLAKDRAAVDKEAAKVRAAEDKAGAAALKAAEKAAASSLAQVEALTAA